MSAHYNFEIKLANYFLTLNEQFNAHISEFLANVR